MAIPTFPTSNSVVFATTLANADGTGLKALLTTQPKTFVIDAVVVSSNDTIIHHVDLTVVFGALNLVVASAAVAAGVGTGGVATVDVLASGAPATVTNLPLTGAQTLSVNVEEAVTAGKLVTVTAFGHYP